jgi:lipoprotein-releasing system ATP-binding protein
LPSYSFYPRSSAQIRGRIFWRFFALLKVEDVSKDYPSPRGVLSIVSAVSLTLSRGDAVSIMGPSGSGKSTLLYMMGALEPPSRGTITLNGQNPFQLEEKALAAFRNKESRFRFSGPLPAASMFRH